MKLSTCNQQIYFTEVTPAILCPERFGLRSDREVCDYTTHLVAPQAMFHFSTRVELPEYASCSASNLISV